MMALTSATAGFDVESIDDENFAPVAKPKTFDTSNDFPVPLSPVTATSLARPLNVTSTDGPRPAMLHALIDDKRLNGSISDGSSRRSLDE
mmetsp:Transcript_1309/g.2802  ORF Transcript_1309/g.2802 Transcript_1309/m.2802 type:complete len:90 (+) Transcript_1309:966-1235(+)